MLNAICRATVAATVLAFAGNVGAAIAQPPVSAFGNLPYVGEPKLSPDGKHFAVIQSLQGRPVILIYTTNAPAGSQPVMIPTEDWIAENIFWANSNRLIFIMKKNEKPTGFREVVTWYRSLAIGADGTNPVVLMARQRGYSGNTYNGRFIGLNLDDPDHILATFYTPYDWNSDRVDLLRVDVNTGKTETVARGGTYDQGWTTDWIVDNHADIIARTDWTDYPPTEHLLLNRSGRYEEVLKAESAPDKGMRIYGLTQDGTGLVISTFGTQATQALSRFDLVTGKITPLYSNPDYDVDHVTTDEWTARITGAVYFDDSRKVHYFDPKLQSLQAGLEKAFPGLIVSQISLDVAGDKMIVRTDGARQPPTYFYLDRTTHQATEIASAYPDLRPADLGEEKPYPYKARDGLDIHAYLTLPPGKEPKNLPVVVMPHGGPDARDEIGFDWWAQFLANRGYAVLQPNYRGSYGYGRAFTAAGLHQWGLKMQDDITDGVKKLIADGTADPKRICIVGASYGGYAALAGATFTPDLYACAVSWAGVSDLQESLKTEIVSTGRDSSVVSFWRSRIGGNEVSDTARLVATSPARNADKVKCPILLMHGESDTTVRINQSEIEENALRKAGKTVEFIRFPGGEDHYMNVADTRIRVLTETEAFLKKYIGN